MLFFMIFNIIILNHSLPNSSFIPSSISSITSNFTISHVNSTSYLLLLSSPNSSSILTISSKNRNCHVIFHDNSYSYHLQSSLPTGTSSQLKSLSSALLAVLLFLRPVLPNISMTTSRLTLPSCNRYCTLLARLSVPQSAIKLPSISKR